MSWKILFVGPANFNADSWKTRAEYILPDLFASAGADAELHLLTAKAPDFARESLRKLLAQFNVRHYEVGRHQRSNRTEKWIEEVTTIADANRVGAITNLFGSQWLGEVIATAAKRTGAQSIIRVPGDEIGSRVAMGVYTPDTEEYREALEAERAGYVAAHRIIAMSPWEAQRIRTAIGTPTDKVTVCIRGVDLDRFHPLQAAAPDRPRKRFLFVGRKSAEKGYDLIEAAAQRVHAIDPTIEFVFVGNFEPQRIENRNYVGWVETRDLPQLYRSVDAFALTSRSEGFPQVVAEAMASGLPCILSRHLFSTVFEHGVDALLCDLSASDIAEQVLAIARDAELGSRLARRARNLAETALDQRIWTRRYEAIMHARPVEARTVFDHGAGEAAAMPSPAEPAAQPAANRPRLLFVTPRPLGLMATPGTYLSVEGYAEHCEVEVVAKPITSDGEIIVHTPSKPLPVTLLDPDQADFEECVIAVIRRFRPDVVCLASWLRAPRLIKAVRSTFPAVKICLEVKSPVLNPDPVRRAQNAARWERVEHCLDGIIAPSRGMVETYLPNYSGPLLQHRSILDYGKIGKRTFETDRLVCRRFVFSGSLAHLRQIDKLLRLIAGLPADILRVMQVDFFGDGPARGELEALAREIGLEGTVRFLGAVQQAELFRMYREYDAGIAWVPTELYDSAPSLKLIEYCAAGIAPLATASSGHLLLKEHGFHIDYFDEHKEESFAELIAQVCSDGVDASGLCDNIRRAEKFDYRSVTGEEILPFYFGLSAPRQKGSGVSPDAGAAQDSNDLMISQAFAAWRTQTLRDAAADVRDIAPGGGLMHERLLHAKRMRHPPRRSDRR